MMSFYLKLLSTGISYATVFNFKNLDLEKIMGNLETSKKNIKN